MTRLRARALLTIAAAALLDAPPAAAADLALTLGAASDYDFRGVSQTGTDELAELDLELSHESLRAWVWAGNVDFGDTVDGNLEVDFGLGWELEPERGPGWDLGAVWYRYPGSHEDLGDVADPADDVEAAADYAELYAGLEHAPFSGRLWYSPDLYESGESASYLEAALTFDLPAELELSIHAGYSFGDYFKSLGEHLGASASPVSAELFAPAEIVDTAYWDYSIGIERSVKRTTLELRYVWTDIDRSTTLDDGESTDARLVFSIGTTFALRDLGAARRRAVAAR